MRCLHALRKLHAAANEIDGLDADWFSELPSLTDVNLSRNRLAWKDVCCLQVWRPRAA